jgi:purine-binding chemotaxis protein CheW
MRRIQHNSESGTVSRRQHLLVFRVGGQAYGLPLLMLREILPIAELLQIPAQPASVAGFLNLGGEAIAVLHAARFFGCPESPPTLYTPMLVLRRENPALALLVEGIEGVVEFAPTDLVPIVPGTSIHDCARGLIRIDHEHVVLLDEERLVTQEEARRLAEWAAHEQSRMSEPSPGAV